MGALSKGCRSCIKRKIKCDETRPNCTRCRTASIECSGFESKLRLRFVDEVPRIRRSIAVSRKKHQKIAKSTIEPLSVFDSSQIDHRQLPWHAPFSANTLTLTGFKDEIFISYLLAKMFEKETYPLDTTAQIRCGLPADWIPELIAAPRKQRSKSWDALAAMVFGQAHKDFVAIIHAHRLYGQALIELRRELSCPTGTTLMTMTALYKYEMLVSTTEKGWISHAEGLEWLLEQRGPWQQKSYAGKTIFLEHRLMLVAKSIVSRQGSFLRNAIWKTVPWEDNPTSKLAIDYLIDIGADIAEYVSQINPSDDTQRINYSYLRLQVARSLKDLNSWWRHWQRENKHSVLEISLCANTSPSIFTTPLKYDRLDIAFTICVYNAMRILLLQLWQTLQQLPKPVEANHNIGVVLDLPNETALLGITSNIQGLASEILRSLGCCYREFPSFVCSVSFLFIQDVAYSCFDPDSKEATWVAKHGWAESEKSEYIEESNLLEKLLPFGRMKAGGIGSQ